MPGFNRQMLETLHQKHESDSWQFTKCILMIDGMCLREHIQWNSTLGHMEGLVDIGTGPGAFDESDGELATESVVFLAVGVLGHWKAPVAYFFVNKLSAAVQSGLVKDCIIELSNVGLCVEAIVMDPQMLV